jgi:hypothetical protein
MADFDAFLKEYGSPINPQRPDTALLSAYERIVPELLSQFWGRIGFAHFAEGLVWVTNPKPLEEVLKEWVPVKRNQIPAVCVVRSAFGKVIFWFANKFVLLDVHYNDRFEAGNDTQVLFDVFLTGKDARSGILQEPLFDRALRKLGPLAADEMYSFKLPIAMGGDRSVKNIIKVKMREQLSILAQLQKG